MAEEKNRRDFIYTATGAVAAIGIGGLAWPLIAQLNPAGDAVDPNGPVIDLSLIGKGEQVKLIFENKPIFIRHRTGAEIQAAQAVRISDLPHPESDNDRLRPNSSGELDPRYIVMVGICSHFGCVPVAEMGDFDGWYCPCHAAHFDTSGRVRKGPAPTNMEIPYYVFLSDNIVQLMSYQAYVAVT